MPPASQEHQCGRLRTTCDRVVLPLTRGPHP